MSTKGEELPKGHPGRKYNARMVFSGDAVNDHNWDVAMFQELSSAPAAIGAARLCDLIARLPGHNGQLADAAHAYAQAYVEGTAARAELPDNCAPTWANWQAFRWLCWMPL